MRNKLLLAAKRTVAEFLCHLYVSLREPNGLGSVFWYVSFDTHGDRRYGTGRGIG